MVHKGDVLEPSRLEGRPALDENCFVNPESHQRYQKGDIKATQDISEYGLSVAWEHARQCQASELDTLVENTDESCQLQNNIRQLSEMPDKDQVWST